jgi:hypothetical protein
MQQNAGLFSQHVSSIIMHYYEKINQHFVASSWLLFYIIYDAQSHEHQRYH